MENLHLFVVKNHTFPVHLKYRFAGTYPGEKHSIDKPHWALQADVARIKTGDLIVFYLENVGFFGIFRVTSAPFWDSGPVTHYEEELGIPLVYRVLFEHYEVYSEPVTEMKALDLLPEYSREILWGPIYRKLKGARGCMPLIPREASRLLSMIRRGTRLNVENNELTYDQTSTRIITTFQARTTYDGITRALPSVRDRLTGNKLSSESSLQAELMRLLRSPDDCLSRILLDTDESIEWAGNEIYCGAGMQKTDILLMSRQQENVYYYLIELKKDHHQDTIHSQVTRYREWASNFFDIPQNRLISVVLCSPQNYRNWQDQNAMRVYELSLERIRSLYDNLNGSFRLIYYRRTPEGLELKKVI